MRRNAALWCWLMLRNLWTFAAASSSSWKLFSSSSPSDLPPLVLRPRAGRSSNLAAFHSYSHRHNIRQRRRPTIFSKTACCRMASTATSSTTRDEEDNDQHEDNLLQGLPSPLILGSASFTRKLILREMGLPYRIVVRPIDESRLGNRDTDPPKQLVHTLAHAKMDHLIQEIQAGNCREDLSFGDDDDKNNECIVLTADQVVTCDGQILEKPRDLAQAKAFVARYGRHPCSTVGCVVLHHLPSHLRVSDWHVATLHFQKTLADPQAADQLVDALVSDRRSRPKVRRRSHGGAPARARVRGPHGRHRGQRHGIEQGDGPAAAAGNAAETTGRKAIRSRSVAAGVILAEQYC